MKKEVGLWIDHTKAVIVTVTGKEEETRRVRSNIEKHIHFSGGSLANPLFGAYSISGDGEQVHHFTSCLNTYYDRVISLIRYADSIWIFGPGEAKEELEKHMLRNHLSGPIVGIDVENNKMTDRQIAAKVSQHYQT